MEARRTSVSPLRSSRSATASALARTASGGAGAALTLGMVTSRSSSASWRSAAARAASTAGVAETGGMAANLTPLRTRGTIAMRKDERMRKERVP
jgi:hypothetical protein